jgi:hypothetical protein
MSMNGALPESYPPGANTEERVVNTWRAVMSIANREADLHAAVIVIDSKVSRIMAKLGISSSVPLPSMRPPADSVHDFESLKVRAEAAAAEGERKPGTDAATEVRRLFEEEESKREAIRQARRLAELEAEALQRQADRRKFWVGVVKTITGGLGLTGAVELAKWLATLHH